MRLFRFRERYSFAAPHCEPVGVFRRDGSVYNARKRVRRKRVGVVLAVCRRKEFRRVVVLRKKPARIRKIFRRLSRGKLCRAVADNSERRRREDSDSQKLFRKFADGGFCVVGVCVVYFGGASARAEFDGIIGNVRMRDRYFVVRRKFDRAFGKQGFEHFGGAFFRDSRRARRAGERKCGSQNCRKNAHVGG